MSCNCEKIKDELASMREQIELMRHHGNSNYTLLIEIRDKIGSECTNIMQFLYPLAMRSASQEFQEKITRSTKIGGQLKDDNKAPSQEVVAIALNKSGKKKGKKG